MKEFTNLHIREAYRKKLFIVIVGAILMVLGVIFLVWGIVVVNKTDKNEKSFEKIAVVEKNLDNKKAYINVKNMPFRFATYGNSDSSYYIVEGLSMVSSSLSGVTGFGR